MELLAWGANSYGQLGLGFKSEQVLTPTSVSIQNLDANDIKQISGGAGHTVILTKNHSVFSCGWNNKGQLGANVESESLIFIKILQNHQIVQISSGWDFNAAISNKNELLVWGSNTFSQLGVPKQVTDTSEPILIEGCSAKQVSCGLRHLAVVKTDGTVATCGTGNRGQLGVLVNGTKLKMAEFVAVPDLRDVISVSCGQFHTLALQLGGVLYGWGSNAHGQLGCDPNTVTEVLTPLKIDLNLAIPAEIHTGWTHSVVVTADGDLVNFGRNSYSQLGSEREKTWMPAKLDCEKVKQFAAGSEHNLAVTVDGKLLCWGWNEHGNCGNGDLEDVTKPREIRPNGSCVYVSCGTGQSFAICNK